MKITIENTSKTVELNGLPARVWEGETDSGIKVICFITRIAVDKSQDESQFKAELMECKEPSKEAQAFSLRYIL